MFKVSKVRVATTSSNVFEAEYKVLSLTKFHSFESRSCNNRLFKKILNNKGPRIDPWGISSKINKKSTKFIFNPNTMFTIIKIIKNEF